MSDPTKDGASNQTPNRRDVLLASTALAAASTITVNASTDTAYAQSRSAPNGPPNIVYFLVDNLGYGELGCYGGGILRGADTKRIDAFSAEGMKLLNFAPEAQCTPSRSALMTGRYAVRSGNHTVAFPAKMVVSSLGKKPWAMFYPLVVT
jgi:arylsulfatase